LKLRSMAPDPFRRAGPATELCRKALIVCSRQLLASPANPSLAMRACSSSAPAQRYRAMSDAESGTGPILVKYPVTMGNLDGWSVLGRSRYPRPWSISSRSLRPSRLGGSRVFFFVLFPAFLWRVPPSVVLRLNLSLALARNPVLNLNPHLINPALAWPKTRARLR